MSDEKFTIERHGREWVFSKNSLDIWEYRAGEILIYIMQHTKNCFRYQIYVLHNCVQQNIDISREAAAIAAIDALVKLVTDTGLFVVKESEEAIIDIKPHKTIPYKMVSMDNK